MREFVPGIRGGMARLHAKFTPHMPSLRKNPRTDIPLLPFLWKRRVKVDHHSLMDRNSLAL